MIKRTFSVLFVCLLLMTATTVGAVAQDTTREAVIDSILEYHHNSITEDDLAYLIYEPLSNGGIFCNWDLKTVGHATVTVPVQLGKYVIDGNKGFDYHVYYQGTLYRIEKAYEIGVLTEEDLESLFAAGTLRIYDIVEPTETQVPTSATPDEATPSSAGKSASGPAIKTGDTVIGFVGIALLMCAAVCVMIRRRKTEE